MKNILFFLFIAALISCGRTGDEHTHAGEEHSLHKHDEAGHDHEAGTVLHEHDAGEHDHEATAGLHKHDADEHDHEATVVDSAGYRLLKLAKQPFSFVLRTGGRITVDSRDIVFITARSSGLVKLSNDYLFPGIRISNGEVLFTISGEQLAEDNTELNFRQIKADLEQATANYNRAKQLISDKIITETDFLAAKNDYEKLLNSYENLNATSGGNLVRASGGGYLKEIFVTEGQKVIAGQKLASLVIEHNLVLKADVSPDHLRVLPSITTANFTVGYSDKLYRLSDMNGRKISMGKSTGENSYYIPLYFRLDFKPELIEGTFAEVYLIGGEIKDAIVVPNKALMEEYGKMYVFVAEAGKFIKKYIETGYTDGEQTMVYSGLTGNETIVCEGTYRVKLMNTVTTSPAHNH
jgi:RND family efflux transporter MFP subunit